jgi:hypothetical protein
MELDWGFAWALELAREKEHRLAPQSVPEMRKGLLKAQTTAASTDFLQGSRS